MEKTILVIALLFCTLSIKAQQAGPKVKRSLLSAYILPLKIAYEQGIGDKYTTEISAGLTGFTEIRENNVAFVVAPVIRGDFKYFYNLEKRWEKGKNVDLNSGNFWGFATRYTFQPIGDKNNYREIEGGALFIAPMWGIQRNYPSHLSIGLNLGYGVAIAGNTVTFDPLIHFRLGFILFSGN